MEFSFVRELVIDSFVRSSDTGDKDSIDIQVNMSEFTQGFIALMHKLCFSKVNNITCIETKVNSSKKSVTIDFCTRYSILYTYTINVNINKLLCTSKKLVWYTSICGFTNINECKENISKAITHFSSNITELFTTIDHHNSAKAIADRYWDIVIPGILKFVACNVAYFNVTFKTGYNFDRLRFRSVTGRNQICFYGTSKEIISDTPKAVITNTSDVFTTGFRILIDKAFCTRYVKSNSTRSTVLKNLKCVSEKLTSMYNFLYNHITRTFLSSTSDTINNELSMFINYFSIDQNVSDVCGNEEKEEKTIEETNTTQEEESSFDTTFNPEVTRLDTYVQETINSITEIEKCITSKTYISHTSSIENDRQFGEIVDKILSTIFNPKYDDLLSDLTYGISITDTHNNHRGTIGIDIHYKGSSIIRSNIDIDIIDISNKPNTTNVITIYGSNKTVISSCGERSVTRVNRDKNFYGFIKNTVNKSSVINSTANKKRQINAIMDTYMKSSDFRVISNHLNSGHDNFCFVSPIEITRDAIWISVTLGFYGNNNLITSTEYICTRITFN